jgi:hypothetical protein
MTKSNRRQRFSNDLFSIDDLTTLTKEQKEEVLMWFARKLWVLLEEGSGNPDYYGKAYDPLLIEGNIAHSYVFDFQDGGRHHDFENLSDLEKMLMQEGIDTIQLLIGFNEVK